MKTMQKPKVFISGTGSYLPQKCLTNEYFEKIVETSDEWIVQRTGIKERRMAAENEATSDLAFNAAQRAISDAGLTPEDIDQIIVGTVTPDTLFPSTACLLQHRLGCRHIPSFDLLAACSGFLYALDVGCNTIIAGSAKNVLVVGAESLTRITDYEDRRSCILFGDGAGAAVLSEVKEGSNSDKGILSVYLGADGSGADLLTLPAGGSRIPASKDSLENRQHYIKVEGQPVYKQAVTKIVQMVNSQLANYGLTHEQISLIIPHQMNARIIESVAGRLKIPAEKIFINLDKYGNTSAATIPVAIDEAAKQGRVKDGDLVVLVTFGGGLTWGSALIRW